MTANQILETLRKLAPSVSVAVHWEPDGDAPFSEISHCFDDPDPDDWQAWQSEVVARAIVRGNEVCGNAHLGGTWEKSADHPATSNPDISGYLPQMIEEALQELRGMLPLGHATLSGELEAAIAFIKTEMRNRYDEQRADLVTA